MNDSNLAAKLQGLTAAAKATAPAAAPAPAAPAAPAADATHDFKGTNPEDKAKKDAEAQRRSQIAAAIREKAVKLNTPRGKVLQLMSQNARICGYICKTGPKTDFAVKTVKTDSGAKMYSIRLRQSPPSPVIGVIVKYPARLMDALQKQTEADYESLARLAEDGGYIISIEDKDNMPAILAHRSAGYMIEDDKIFQPYYTKKVPIASPGDFKSRKETVPSKSCLYAELGKKADTANVMRMRHSFRGRLQAPGNYIALKEYDTVALKHSYSPDEAAKMIDLYLKRFTVPRGNNNEIVINKLVSENGKLFVTKSASEGESSTPTIVSTAFFPTNAADSWEKDPSLKVEDWYKRNPNGTPVTLSLEEIRLVKKEMVESSKNGMVARVISRELRDTNASADSYRFDPNGAHKNIVDATNGMLTFDTIAAWRPTKKTTSKKAAPATISGMALAGLTLEEVNEVLRRYAVG